MGRGQRFFDAVAEAPSIETKLAAAASAVAQRLAAAEPPDCTIEAAIRWLAHRPSGRVEDLAHHLDWSKRRLHRRFTAALGYGPKTFQRVLRLQRTLALAGHSQGREPLAALALAAGYADQAHMSREVRALAGQSPRHLLQAAQSSLGLSDLFKTEAQSTR
jgi:transcriptional regulator GlxA family with amidase domain